MIKAYYNEGMHAGYRFRLDNFTKLSAVLFIKRLAD